MSLSPEQKRARFERALALGGNTHAIEDVRDLVTAGKAQFWEYGDGVIVTEIHEYPRLKAAHYWLVAGSLRHCLALEHEINPWAIERGCTVATACGREGWVRAAEKTGWRPRPHMVNLYKPLTGAL